MKRSTALLALCTAAGPALAHAPGGDTKFTDFAHHLLLGSHHLPLTLLVLVVLAGAVIALRRRRRTQLIPRSRRAG